MSFQTICLNLTFYLGILSVFALPCLTDNVVTRKNNGLKQNKNKKKGGVGGEEPRNSVTTNGHSAFKSREQGNKSNNSYCPSQYDGAWNFWHVTVS